MGAHERIVAKNFCKELPWRFRVAVDLKGKNLLLTSGPLNPEKGVRDDAAPTVSSKVPIRSPPAKLAAALFEADGERYSHIVYGKEVADVAVQAAGGCRFWAVFIALRFLDKTQSRDSE